MNGERSSSSGSYRFESGVNRTTDKLKVNFNASANYNKNDFIVDEDTPIKTHTDNWDINSLLVKSLGPKWSFGGRASIHHSSFSNEDLVATAAPGVEYDFFPYSESARRSVTVQYTAGGSRYRFAEVTIFDRLQQVVPIHELRGMLALKQPWGSIQLESTFSQHLNHPDLYHASLFGETEVRLFKGFSFNIFGQYQRINDQIALRRAAATTEDVLLRLQQLATSYSYFMAFGVNYSFGSIFNNVVNTRFGR
jgi:hypothetical protein